MHKNNNKQPASFSVGWKVSANDVNVASVRYRAILPVLALKDKNISSTLFSDVNSVDVCDFDILVIVKGLTVADLRIAHDAHKRNIPIVLDLCDNIFVESYGKRPNKKRRYSIPKIFAAIANISEAIVVPTETLATIVKDKVRNDIRVHVIPDGIEDDSLREEIINTMAHMGAKKNSIIERAEKKVKITHDVFRKFRKKCPDKLFTCLFLLIRKESKKVNIQSIFKSCYRFLTKKLEKLKFIIYRTRNRLNQTANTKGFKKVLWFGNHGAPYAKFGILDLLKLRKVLEKIAEEIPLELIVVSNNVDKYTKYIKPFKLNTKYVEWSPRTINEHIRNSDIVVIPNSLDPFSISKSANRTALALSLGTPVVATSTPSLMPLKGCIILDNFKEGIMSYLNDPLLVQRHMRRAQKRIHELYSQDVIGTAWSDVLKGTKNNYRLKDKKSKPELIFILQLPQDVELARPIWLEAIRQGVRCALWTSVSAISRWPQLFDEICDSGLSWDVFPDNLNESWPAFFVPTVKSIISITETNQPPHSFSHQLTKLANLEGIVTGTVQHGLENIGLTYSDDVHNIKKIEIASRYIFIWGDLCTLHPDIPIATREKCIPVGCPKPEMVPAAKVTESLPQGIPIVGIFENLHWHRYSENYRDFFIQSINEIITKYPDIYFVLKPHNAGMWLTGRYKGERPEAENLFIINPMDTQWRKVTAAQLFGCLTGVITTPSTVALDSARAGIPTAVVENDLVLTSFDPLPLINTFEDMQDFINQIFDKQAILRLRENAYTFVKNSVIYNDAPRRILNEMLNTRVLDSKYA